MRKLTASAQQEITQAISALPEGHGVTMKQAGDAYRNDENDSSAATIVTSLALLNSTAATQKSSAPKAVSQKAKATAAQKAKAQEEATKAKADAAASKSKVLPATPEGWEAGESREGFVRYARRLRSSGQPVSAYRLAAAKRPEEVGIANELRKEFPNGTFVVVNHTTNAKGAFDSWADAYAFTCTMNNTNLARSVAAAIGEEGLKVLTGMVGAEVTVRPEMVPAPEAEATPAPAAKAKATKATAAAK